MRSCTDSGSLESRRGTVIYVVLVVVVLLSLGAYSFSELMFIEAQSADLQAKTVQARALTDSGVELVAAMLAQRGQISPETFYNNPGAFRTVSLHADENGGAFSILAPVEGASGTRFGLQDESSKININLLVDAKIDEEVQLEKLAAIPYMTAEIAAAVLDWIDDDTTPRANGAEDEYYSTLSPPYATKNGALDSLEELLMVRGITPQLFLGEDANRNGMLDPEENDGDTSAPMDNADGVLDRGLASFLTVSSREMNRRSNGDKKLNLNTNSLSTLYDTIEEEYSEDMAKFIIAYRLYGPYSQTGNENNSGEQDGNNNNSNGNSQDRDGLEDLDNAARAIGGALASTGGSVSRGGMDLTNGGQFTINSLFDLVGAQVRGNIGGQPTTLESPWSDNPGDMTSYLPQMFDEFTLTAEDYVSGRVNINQARYEVLLSIPEMTEELAYSISQAQLANLSGGGLASPQRATVGWLFIEGLTDLETLKKLAPYVTARGDVYTAQIVGFYQIQGPVSRVEAIIDGTQNPPHLLFYRDLSDLGRGYSLDQLMGR